MKKKWRGTTPSLFSPNNLKLQFLLEIIHIHKSCRTEILKEQRAWLSEHILESHMYLSCYVTYIQGPRAIRQPLARVRHSQASNTLHH